MIDGQTLQQIFGVVLPLAVVAIWCRLVAGLPPGEPGEGDDDDDPY